jgi:hypothetical protein
VGDTFQIIADVDASESEAPALAASVVAWLHEAGIIAGEQADCVLGAAAGYPPGPDYAAAVTDPDELLPGLKVNGVEVTAARSAFLPAHGELGPVACPRCGAEVALQDPAGAPTAHWERFSAALGNWMAGQPTEVTCPYCLLHAGLNDWYWGDDWPVAVGFLGVTFWNWPPLSRSFIARVQDHLGHRVVVTRGKL